MLECNRRLLQMLREERSFFRTGGYGRPFRSEWRPTLLFRDSPTCINFTSTGDLDPCRKCPLLLLVPPLKRDEAIPCHHIEIDSAGNTVAELYQRGSQKRLDQCYRDWLSAAIWGLEQSQEAS
jgi:hypothetical protein